MTAASVVLAYAGCCVMALGVMVGALHVADLVVRTLRRKAGR